MHLIAPLHVRSTLCFSQGTGGHFLLGAAGHGWREVNVHYNEYKANIQWCDLEEITIEELIDDMYDSYDTDSKHDADTHLLASRWLQHLTVGQPQVLNLASHVLPVVTSRLFDFHTEELLLLPAADDLKEYIAALCYIKNMFTSDWSKYPHKIWNVLIAYRSVAHRPGLTTRFHSDMHKFRTALFKANVCPREYINDSCIAWCWWLTCVQHDWDIGDITQFCQWVTKAMYTMLEITSQLHASPQSINQINHHKLIELNYADIFFDLKPPQCALLADLDMSRVDSYVLKNHQILQDMMGIFDRSVQESIRQTVRRSKHSF